MRGYATDVRRYYEGYKRQAGLPAVYQPLIGYQAQPELHNPMANNENKQVVAYQNQSETPISDSRIIQF